MKSWSPLLHGNLVLFSVYQLLWEFSHVRVCWFVFPLKALGSSLKHFSTQRFDENRTKYSVKSKTWTTEEPRNKILWCLGITVVKKKRYCVSWKSRSCRIFLLRNLPHQTTGVCGRTFTLNRLFRDGRAHGIVQNTSTKTAQSRNISYMFLLPPSISSQRVFFFFNCLLCFLI